MKFSSVCRDFVKVCYRFVFKHKNFKALRALNKELMADYSTAADFLKNQPANSIYQLTDSDKHEIDEYWAQYGVKFPDYTWFQMYYSVSGIHSPKFLINIFVLSSIYKYYNAQKEIHSWVDKNISEKLVHNVKFPDSLVHKINGRYYDDEYKPFDDTEDGLKRLSEKIFAKLNGETEVIVKESKDSRAGLGVKLIKNLHCADDVKNVLKENKSRNYIIQRKIMQHPFFDQFCSTSVNIIRFNSWHDKNEVKIFPATLRFGVEGSSTDITFVGGKEILNGVGIDEDGFINDKFRWLDGVVENHPIITDKQVPIWNELLNAVIEAHKELYHFDFVGWDFTVDRDCNPICIEFNVFQPGTILYQFTNGPMAGKYTDEFLAFLKKRPEYIPQLFRLKQ